MRIIQLARFYRLDWRYFRKTWKLISDDIMDSLVALAEPGRKFSVRMRSMIVLSSMLVPPLSLNSSTAFCYDTEESLFRIAWLKLQDRTGTKVLESTQIIHLCACAVSSTKTNSAHRVTLFGTMWVMERNGHFASGIEALGGIRPWSLKRSN